MKPLHLDAASSRAGLGLGIALLTLFAHLVACQDQANCQPYRWDSLGSFRALDAADPVPTEGTYIIVQPGEINCRYWGVTPAEVNYYTCTQLAQKHEIPNDKLFSLNPDLERDCSNIKPRTEYCVKGFIEPLRAHDGRCGPRHNNATCVGTDKQCCNSETWTCGDSPEDCAPGTCYEGVCEGDLIYSTDGTCGYAHGNRACVGKWGKCCSLTGKCGTGEDFCGLFNCQKGDCELWKYDDQPAGTPWTPDGTCGGADGFRCSADWGRCCNVLGVCGELPADCYVERGCQSEFGICAPSPTPRTSTTTSTTTSAVVSTPSSTSTRVDTVTTGTTTAPGSGTTSSAATSIPTGPAFVPGGGSFTLLGCYREQDGSRALPDLVADDNMTIERCLAAAAGRTFAGVAYGRECWFGSGLRTPLTKVDDDNCKFLCPGNPLQYCGSGNHLVLYSTGDLPRLPSHPPTVGAFAFYDCMTEATGARALAGDTIATDDMTLERCADFCGSKWKYFGVEYGRECYCGNSFNEGSVAASATDCNMPCVGNGLELCGAGNRLSVYGRD